LRHFEWLGFGLIFIEISSQDRRHGDGVYGGAMVMETTMIPKVILFTI
jgi:hypothetical protein